MGSEATVFREKSAHADSTKKQNGTFRDATLSALSGLGSSRVGVKMRAFSFDV